MMKRDKTGRIGCPLMNLLVRSVLDEDSGLDSSENRTRLGMLAGWTSAVLSLVLCVVKGWLGFVSGSVSMVADATNNLTDMGSSLVIALGFKWSRKPSDADHPFGHGRIEAVVTFVLAIALILVGFEVAQSGIMRLIRPKPVDASMWILVVIWVTILVKLWMAIFARGLAKLSKSHVLEADAWNHAFDVLSTLLVVLALVGSKMGWSALDGWTAIAVALFILFTGVKYAREAVDILLGTAPDAEDVKSIQQLVEKVAGVFGVHEIMIHQYGDVKMVSFHIEVDVHLSAVEAHQIAENVEYLVEKELGWRTIVHADPIDRSHPFFKEVYAMLKTHVAGCGELMDFHDIRIFGEHPPYRVSFDLVTGEGARRNKYEVIYEQSVKRIKETFGNRVSEVEIGIEAVVDSAPMERKKILINKL